MTARVLVIGYGNPLRRDDGVGQHLAEQLAAMSRDDRVDIRALHQLTPELAEPISQAGLVIFIDACHEGIPGEWKHETLLPHVPPSTTFTHQIDPTTLLAFTRELYGRCPEAILYTITGESFDNGEGLSPSIQANIPTILDSLCGQMRSFLTVRQKVQSNIL